MDTIASATPRSITPDENGEALLEFTPPKAGVYVFVPTVNPALIDVYEGSEPIELNRKLHMELWAKKGSRDLDAVPHLIRIRSAPGLPLTLSVRPWSFWDYTD
jgi:hypothetical protein